MTSSTVTRKTFEAVAQIINGRATQYDNLTAVAIATDLATYFAAENPLFDVGRFMEACGADEQEWTQHGGFGPREIRLVPGEADLTCRCDNPCSLHPADVADAGCECECSCHPFQAQHGAASSACTGCGCPAR